MRDLVLNEMNMYMTGYWGYLLLSGIVLAISYRNDWREWLVSFITVAFLPIIGWLLPSFWNRNRKIMPDTHYANMELFNDMDNFALKQSRIYVQSDTEKELNTIPLEEALLINDFSTRRRTMIDIMRTNTLEQIEILQKAVSNEDTETSHYAVSAIMEIKRKLTLSIQELSVKYENNKEDPELLRLYTNVLKSYMKSGFIDERTLLKYKYIVLDVLAHLIICKPDDITAYVQKIEVELELGEYNHAEVTAKKFLDKFPLYEEAYLLLLKVYYTRQSFDKFRDTLDKLKKSTIKVSNKGSNIIRFWS